MQHEGLYKIITNYFSNKPVKKVMLFGSFSRGDEKSSSDIDLIINLEHPVGLFTIGKYISELETLTQRKIDIATQNSITPEFYDFIRKDLKVVYES